MGLLPYVVLGAVSLPLVHVPGIQQPHNQLGRIAGFAVVDIVASVVVARAFNLNVFGVLAVGTIMHVLTGVATPGTHALGLTPSPQSMATVLREDRATAAALGSET